MAVAGVQRLNRVEDHRASDLKKSLSGTDILKEAYCDIESHRGKEVRLKVKFVSEVHDAVLEIGSLEDTIYVGRPYMLDSWKSLYLNKYTNLKVLGVLNGLPCLAPGLQFVILVAEDGIVYAYENEVLHKIGENIKQLGEGKGVIPGTKVYEYGNGCMPKTEGGYQHMVNNCHSDVASSILKSRTYTDSKADQFGMLIDLL